MAPTLIFFLLAGVCLYKALGSSAKRTATWGRSGSGAPLARVSYAAWAVAFASVPPAAWWALTSGSIRPLCLIAAALLPVAGCAVSDRARARVPCEHSERTLARRALPLVLLLAVIVPMGFLTKLYSGPFDVWVSGYAGGVLYVVFWILLVGMALSRAAPAAVAGFVLGVTSMLEVLQTVSNPVLDSIRATSLGRIWIGSTFSWWDFPHYLLGGILGAWILSRIPSVTEVTATTADVGLTNERR